MASWLVRSWFEPWGLLLKGPRRVFAPRNLTELFYLHAHSITRSSFHTTFFRSIHRSDFRYRFTKNGFTGAVKSLRVFRETWTCSGTLSCVLG